MEFLQQTIDLFLHLDREHLSGFVQCYHVWIYLILFMVIFCETGLVVTPFLPGDSLLFVTGAVAAKGDISVGWLFVALSVAAIAGDTVNYWMGAWIGPRAFTSGSRWLKKEHLDRTHTFFQRYGGKTIILARFVPVVRTFAPFVAGIGAMNYARFILYNIAGGIGWVAFFLFVGYWLSDWLESQGIEFRWVTLVIIFVSILPMIIELIRARLRRS
jgi:membrane-associated protein